MTHPYRVSAVTLLNPLHLLFPTTVSKCTRKRLWRVCLAEQYTGLVGYADRRRCLKRSIK